MIVNRFRTREFPNTCYKEIKLKKQQQLYFGADYNPEQWNKEIIFEDIQLMKQANVNYVSINIFGWANIEPEEGRYDFEFLDWLMNLLHENQIYVDLANGTASPPAWLVEKYPEMMPKTVHGNRLVHGSRQHYCPTSNTYRAYAKKLTEVVAKQYANHPALEMWHVNNEYTCHIHECYCDNCRAKFIEWLQEKYETLENLNDAWATKFWSQTYTNWAQIFLPEEMPTFKNPTQQLDYIRFISDMNLEIFEIEKKAIQKYSHDIPIMTNLMGLHKYVDGFKWAKNMDVVSWNSYPNPYEIIPYPQFMANDLTRSLKKQPFLIMEQATSAVNWRKVNGAKRPGQMRLWNYEAIAHGSDGQMYFQWRQSKGGAEKFHSAIVPHGCPQTNRIFKEVCELGEELSHLGELVGTNYVSDIAVVFDWNNWWALELEAKPNGELKYIHEMTHIYKVLRELNIGIDFVHPDEDLTGYSVVIAPTLYSATLSFGEKIKKYVSEGGVFLTDYFSGIVNENDQVYLGGYPGLFRDVLGITIDEFFPLKSNMGGRVNISGKSYSSSTWQDMIQLENAKVVAKFETGSQTSYPAITKNSYGEGEAYYFGTKLENTGLKEILKEVTKGITFSYTDYVHPNYNVSISMRKNEHSVYLFILNYNDTDQEIILKKDGFSLLNQESVNKKYNISSGDVCIIKFPL